MAEQGSSVEDAVGWLRRSVDSKSPSVAQLHSAELLSERDRLLSKLAAAKARAEELQAEKGAWKLEELRLGQLAADKGHRQEAAEARAVRAEAALRDIPPTDQLSLWLKADLVALLDDLRDAGQEGKP